MTLSRRAAVLSAPLLAVVCAFGIVFAQTAQAAWPGGNGKIVFYKVDFTTGAAHIYSMNTQGQDQTDLSAAGGGTSPFDFQPSVSPNGKRIAFTRAEVLDPTTIPPTMTGQLWTMNIDGSHQTNISNNGALASESGPSWTEDGSKILFVRQPSGTFPGDQTPRGGLPHPETAGGSIWIRNANGKGTPRQLTSGPHDANPVMSPDGDLIAFSRPVAGARHLFVMKADGKGTPKDLGLGSKPDWSPDSKRLVYGQGGFGPIMVMKVSDPSNPQTLTGLGTEAPAWSPDGTQIAFMHFTSFTSQIALMSATGQNQHDITGDQSSANQKPAWQSVRSREDEQAGR
jgi:Tol biopolymer transport system component